MCSVTGQPASVPPYLSHRARYHTCASFCGPGIFSSSKETDTLRRTDLFPDLMEKLQILKHLYLQRREERLNFLGSRLASEGAVGTDGFGGTD